VGDAPPSPLDPPILLRVDDTRSPSFWVLADRPVILAQTSANSSRLASQGRCALRPAEREPVRAAVRGIHRREAREHGAFPGRARFSSSASCTTAGRPTEPNRGSP